MHTLAVVPARIGSTRLPRKALLPLRGRPIVQWVHEAAASSGEFDRVVVATDDDEIADAVRIFGGDCLLTDPALRTGSERVAAAAALLDDDFDVVANVQGDQPFVQAEDLRALLSPFRDGLAPEMTTVAGPLPDGLAHDPSAVKVVTDLRGRALYFSRSPIPARAGGLAPSVGMRHHLGLYAFRSDFLPVYARLEPTPLELSEQLEQLRALEHGYAILVRDVSRVAIEVNTHADYQRALAHVDEERIS